MKSFLCTLLAALAVAYLGSFFGLWLLPHQEDPYTYVELWQKIEARITDTEAHRPNYLEE